MRTQCVDYNSRGRFTFRSISITRYDSYKRTSLFIHYEDESCEILEFSEVVLRPYYGINCASYVRQHTALIRNLFISRAFYVY